MEDDASIFLDGKTLANLRVVDLKLELEKRGLSKSGSKKDLVKRLKQVSLHFHPPFRVFQLILYSITLLPTDLFYIKKSYKFSLLQFRLTLHEWRERYMAINRPISHL